MPTLNADKERRRPRPSPGARDLLLCCGLALAGCNSAPLASYDLDPAPVPAMNARITIRGALVIPEPRADDPTIPIASSCARSQTSFRSCPTRNGATG